MSDSNSRIAKNTLFLTIRMFVVLVVSLITTRIVLRALGVVDYGVYNVVCGFVLMFSFLNTSMTNGIQRFYNYEIGKNINSNINTIFNTALFIQFLLVIVVVLLTETFGLWYLNNKMVVPADRIDAAKTIFQFSIVSFLFVIMQSPFSALVMAHERMNYYAVVSVLDAFLRMGIALVLSLFAKDKLIVYGGLVLGISVLNWFLYFWYDYKCFRDEIVLKPNSIDKNQFTSMLSFSGWNIFGSFSGMMKEQGINMILNLFFGPIVNAARGVAHQVNGAIKNAVMNLTTAVRPQIVQSYASGNVQRTMKLTFSISKISIAVMYMIAFPIALEIDYILKIWLVDVPEFTATFIRIVMLTSFVDSLNCGVSGVIHASGKMMLYQVGSSLVSLLCLPASYIALKNGCNPSAAFWSVFVFASLSQVVSLFILKTIVDYSIIEYLRQILLPFVMLVIVTFAFPLLVWSFLPSGFFRFVLVFTVSIVAILPTIYFVTLNNDERQLFKRLLGNLKKAS